MPIEEVIDCDLHIAIPPMKALAPYMDDLWRDMTEERGVDMLETVSYPPNSPLTARPDWRQDGFGLDAVRQNALEPNGTTTAICNCLIGVQAVPNPDMAAAFCRAVNDWLAAEWLDKDSRLRGAMLVPLQAPDLAVQEIERLAADRRFVQILLPAMGEMPLGRRHYWPIYEAAARHQLPIAIHPGSSFRSAPTQGGFTSYYVEDYVNQAAAIQSQLTSLIAEGVLSKYEALTVVISEGGFTWMPAYMWRLSKFWRALRMEVPWLHQPPSEIIRDRVRMTIHPLDEPPTAEQMEQILEQLGSDKMLMFSSDFPHWQFDGERSELPAGMTGEYRRKLLSTNARQTYARL